MLSLLYALLFLALVAAGLQWGGDVDQRRRSDDGDVTDDWRPAA